MIILFSFDALHLLSSLCNLQHLSLQLQQQSHDQSSSSPPSKLSNPVCDDPTYATVMAETFPALLWLDKELVGDGMPGREFYDKCRAIEGNRKAQLQLVNHESGEVQFCRAQSPYCAQEVFWLVTVLKLIHIMTKTSACPVCQF